MSFPTSPVNGQTTTVNNITYQYSSAFSSWTRVLNPSGTTYIRKTTNYTAVTGDNIIADTSAGSFTITLPSSPSIGFNIRIVDGANWNTNNLIIARNGSTIEGSASDLTVNTGTIMLHLVYDGTTWQVYPSSSAAGTSLVDDSTTNTTQYLGMSRITSGSWTSGYVSSTKLYFNPSTGVLNSTDYNSLSDFRFKENITSITDSISVLKQLDPVSFNWKDTGKQSYGLIAQEIEKILPNLVDTNQETGIKSVSYLQLIAFLIDAVKHQDEEINIIKQQLKNLASPPL